MHLQRAAPVETAARGVWEMPGVAGGVRGVVWHANSTAACDPSRLGAALGERTKERLDRGIAAGKQRMHRRAQSMG